MELRALRELAVEAGLLAPDEPFELTFPSREAGVSAEEDENARVIAGVVRVSRASDGGVIEMDVNADTHVVYALGVIPPEETTGRRLP